MTMYFLNGDTEKMIPFSILDTFTGKYDSTKYENCSWGNPDANCMGTLLISFWLQTEGEVGQLEGGGVASWANWEKLSSVQTGMEMGTGFQIENLVSRIAD